MPRTYYRSWTFPTPSGNLTVTESDAPNTVKVETDGPLTLTRDQFQDLANLASFISGDYIRYATAAEADPQADPDLRSEQP